MPNLTGKVAIVTGAGRGIGRSHALALAAAGAKIVVNDLGGSLAGEGSDLTPAQQVVAEIAAAGGEAVADGENVADFAGAGRLVRHAVDALGRLDILVNNAGILRDRMLVNMEEDEWDAVITVHLKGHFATTRHAAAHWRERSKAGEDVRARIVERLGNERRLFVLLNRDVRDYVLKLTNQWLGMTYLQVIVAVVVAVLGIVNTLTVSIADRRRELGVLRAVGGLRAQIRGAVWLEAAAIGMIGLTLGIGIGAIMLYYELQAIERDLTGMALDYVFPWGIVAMLVPVILAAALGSAILPAERAVRGSLVEALEYE